MIFYIGTTFVLLATLGIFVSGKWHQYRRAGWFDWNGTIWTCLLTVVLWGLVCFLMRH